MIFQLFNIKKFSNFEKNICNFLNFFNKNVSSVFWFLQPQQPPVGFDSKLLHGFQTQWNVFMIIIWGLIAFFEKILRKNSVFDNKLLKRFFFAMD